MLLAMAYGKSANAEKFCDRNESANCKFYAAHYEQLSCRELLGDFHKVGGRRVTFLLGKNHALERHYCRGRVGHRYYDLRHRFGKMKIGDRAIVWPRTHKMKLVGHTGWFQCLFIRPFAQF